MITATQVEMMARAMDRVRQSGRDPISIEQKASVHEYEVYDLRRTTNRLFYETLRVNVSVHTPELTVLTSDPA